MIYLKNPLCLGMEESEYKEMLALGGMRQKHFEKNEVILSAGCTTHEIGLVLSGSVNIENLDLWGSKSILSNIGAGRLLVYLSNQAAKAGSNHFKIPFDRQGLADYLNVDRSALSKELGKMRDEGILTTRKNAFTLYGLSHEPLLYVSFSKAFH